MRGSSKGGRRRPFRCLPHTPGLLLFMAYWTAAFSAVLATGQTEQASSSVRRQSLMANDPGSIMRKAGIGFGGRRPPGITVAMSPSLPSSSCQPALASLKVLLCSSCTCYSSKQFVPFLHFVTVASILVLTSCACQSKGTARIFFCPAGPLHIFWWYSQTSFATASQLQCVSTVCIYLGRLLRCKMYPINGHVVELECL